MRTTTERNKLVEGNIRLVPFIARQYNLFGWGQDILQEGYLGLISAATTYDSSIAAFSTYAAKCISTRMFTWVRKEKKIQQRVTNRIEFVAQRGILARVDRKLDRIALRKALNNTMASLKSRERLVLITRFGLNGGDCKTLADVGALLPRHNSYDKEIGGVGICGQAARLQESRALTRMRHPSRIQFLAPFYHDWRR